jgi:hypothetical protein
MFQDESQEIYGFDVFTDDENQYLVSHFESNMDACYDLMNDYAKEHNLIMGTFIDKSMNFKLVS